MKWGRGGKSKVAPIVWFLLLGLAVLLYFWQQGLLQIQYVGHP